MPFGHLLSNMNDVNIYTLSSFSISLVSVSVSLFELPDTFTLGIKLKLRNVQTEKLKMIVRFVIIQTC